MSAPAETTTQPKTPVYQRRRRQVYVTSAVVLVLAIAGVVWAVTSGSSNPAALPGFTISVSQGSVASPDSIIESQTSLAKLIPAPPPASAA